ncbi:MAG: hypothetical protein QXU88_00600 [Candidatus Woesearchaeota archaeon]
MVKAKKVGAKKQLANTTRKGYFAGLFKWFASSFVAKPQQLGISIVYDAVYYTLAILVGMLLYLPVKKAFFSVQALMSAAESVGQALPELTTTATQKLLWSLGAFVVLLPIALLFIYTAFKGMVWAVIIGKPSLAAFGKGFYWKFFALNLVWFVFSLPLFSLLLLFSRYVAVLANSATLAFVLSIVLMLLFLHLLTTMHYSFAKTQLVGKSLASIFTIGFGKIHRLGPAYVLGLVVFIVWSQVLWRAITAIGLSPSAQFALLITIIITPVLAWLRIFASGLIEKESKGA